MYGQKNDVKMMDDFRVILRPEGFPDRGDLLVQAVINGQIVPDKNYCLGVDTFFSALGNEHGAFIELTGSCGDRQCCLTSSS